MDLVRYSGASGDFNPIHTDPEFAKSVGLGGTIAHGMFVMAQLGRMATQWVIPSQIRSFNVKFKGMVRPGEMIICRGKIKRKREEGGERLLVVAVEAVSEKEEPRVVGELTIGCE
jgi:acyl dehydratase